VLLILVLSWVSSLSSPASDIGNGIRLVVRTGRLLVGSPLRFCRDGAGGVSSWALFFRARTGVSAGMPVLIDASGPSAASERSNWTKVVRPVVIWVSAKCPLGREQKSCV
jgi:hypothetical protein